ncbi:MAG: DUF2508 family protein [Acutalibacteraceae bacterium]|jgi:hypothetical protein|nr:DUF2508 family protein [Clostridiales bacterium]
MKYNFDFDFETKEEILSHDDLCSDERLLQDIRRVCRMIDDAYLRFQMQADEDLVEASIYEIEALKARYRYLIRLAKTKNITCNTCVTTMYEKI